VQQNDRRPIGGTGFGVTDIQDSGVDLLQRSERRVRSGLIAGTRTDVDWVGCASAAPIIPR